MYVVVVVVQLRGVEVSTFKGEGVTLLVSHLWKRCHTLVYVLLLILKSAVSMFSVSLFHSFQAAKERTQQTALFYRLIDPSTISLPP